MDKIQAERLIKKTLKNKFDKDNFRTFIIDMLDGIDDKDSAKNVGNAQVKECYRKKVVSYQRIGKYSDKEGNIIDALIVHLADDVSLEKARTLQRNFIADYMQTRDKENTLVAFYKENSDDWRFSFVKLDTSLTQDKNGNYKVETEFTPAKRYSFLVGATEPNHTAQSRLIELLIKDYPSLSDIEEAFNVEKVSKEFFANYKELFLRLTENLKSIRENEVSQRIDAEFKLKQITEAGFCKKLLGQLVFLYFIQKKGWLGVKRDEKWGNGDKQFLRHTFGKAVAEGKNFFNDILEPLFYTALNNGERDENWFNELQCKIPFLNGGLFERYKNYDWINTDIIFDNDLFSNTNKTKSGDIGDGILDVFDRYNFTVKEDEPLEKEVAVDPEMLGKVFEELLEVTDRKSKGAFYTPREIVHYMCQESLINYLCTTLNVASDNSDFEKSEQLELIKPKEKQLGFQNILSRKDIENFIHHSDKIVEKEYLATEKEGKNTTYNHIMSQGIMDNATQIDNALKNIKICDPAIGSGAFPVGMLNEIVRARIALVNSGYLRETKKRSLYEYKRQAIQNSIYGVDIDSGAVEIAKLRLWLSLVVDEDNIDNIQALPNLDYKIVCGNSLLNVQRTVFNDSLFKQLEELKPQYFNETKKTEKKRLKKQIDDIIKELTKDGTFDFEIYFSEVFHEKSGFDVVIGNPPYIPYKKIAKRYDLSSYSSFRNKQVNKPNLYVYFIERAFNKLLTSNGILSFINPIAFLVQSDCVEIRKIILSKKINELLDLSYINVFKEADTYTVILNIQNTNQKQDFYYQRYYNVNDIYKLGKNTYPINTVKNDSEYKIILSDYLTLINKINKQHNIIDNYADIICGTSKEGYGKEISDIREPNNMPVLQSSDIKKYKIDWLHKYINKKLFSSKKINSYFFTPKIVMARMTENIRCAYDDKNFYCAKINIIKAKSKKINDLYILLGLLNSKLINFFYKETYRALHKKGDALGFDIPSILKLPTPEFDKAIVLVPIIQNILNITQADNYLENEEKQQKVKEYEKQIDLMVYKLYDLTYEEVLSIDKDIAISQQNYENYQL